MYLRAYKCADFILIESLYIDIYYNNTNSLF